MLSMLMGSKLLKDVHYAEEYERVLNLLSECQYPDGGWPYIKATNEISIIMKWFLLRCLVHIF